METEEVKLACGKCEKGDYKFWAKEFTGIEIVKCQKCALKFVSPRKKEEEIEEVYGDHYWEKLGHTSFNLKRSKEFFNYDMLSLMKGIEYCPLENPSILDIGAGQGGYLKAAKLAGYNKLTANDINDAREAELNKFGIPLIVGNIVSTNVGKYDLINAQHVLEHVTDPFKFLKAIKTSLNPGGVAHISVPNVGGIVDAWKSTLSRIGLKKKQAYKHLAPWHHIFFFNTKSLKHVLEESGFEVLYIGTRNNIKDKGWLYDFVHKLFDKFNWNTHLQAVVKARN